MSYQEQFGFRCEEISQRHRLWGRNLAAVDLDFILLHYHHQRPVALIEFKYKATTQYFDESNPNLCALANLADAAGLPLLLVRYHPSDWYFWLSPGNERARTIAPIRGIQMTEREFVTLLYKIRGEPLPADLLQTLKGSAAEEYGYVAEPLVIPEKKSAVSVQIEQKDRITK